MLEGGQRSSNTIRPTYTLMQLYYGIVGGGGGGDGDRFALIYSLYILIYVQPDLSTRRAHMLSGRRWKEERWC